jgi:hypothetical protein
LNAPIATSRSNYAGNVGIKPSPAERLGSFRGLASNIAKSIKDSLVINWIESERAQFGKAMLKVRPVEATCRGNDRQPIAWTQSLGF